MVTNPWSHRYMILNKAGGSQEKPKVKQTINKSTTIIAKTSYMQEMDM